jgi:acetolactate synthase-1/2/3 large subunit
MGMGCYDERKELSLHMLGMHGALYANKAIQNADVILNIGARFDDRVTGKVADFAPAARRAFMEGTGGIIHVDIAAKQIGKIIPVAVTIVGDALHNIEELKPLLEGEAPKEWVQQCIDWKKKYPFRYRRKEEGKIMKPQRVIEELYTQTAGRKDVLITTGVGQHQMWACQFYRWTHPGSIITSGGLGTMGYGLPAAIGAKIAKPDTMVIDIDGDASLVMTMMEMATAREFNVNVKVLLLNNDFQGMVKQWQDLFFKERHSGTVMTNPNFTKAAEAFGWRGLRCDNEEDLPAMMKAFLEEEGPVLGEFYVEKDEHCLPMINPGAALDDMKIHPDDCPPTSSQ